MSDNKSWTIPTECPYCHYENEAEIEEGEEEVESLCARCENTYYTNVRTSTRR